jgi:hypothetical protein
MTEYQWFVFVSYLIAFVVMGVLFFLINALLELWCRYGDIKNTFSYRTTRRNLTTVRVRRIPPRIR